MAKRSGKRRPPATQVRRTGTKAAALSNRYWDITHRPLQCLVFLLPMIFAYEVGMILIHGRLPENEWPTLAAQQILKWFFSLFGATGYFLPGAALIAVLLAWHLASRQPWKFSGQSLIGMAGESIALAIPLLFLNHWLPALRSMAPLQGAAPVGLTGQVDNLLLSVGAGLYEELVFRLIVISLLMMLFIDVLRIREVWAVAVAVILSSLLFSAHHYQPIGADAWSAPEFAFRTAAGAYLAAVFVLRGFGLAVGCHVIYDVMAFLM
ncbi:MAG: CPBP family intramembrane metalloprotease [Planctomycetes bacterium]|nr:CPBP family intramembrane metalloprotease [Planctomycetota bacterium]